MLCTILCYVHDHMLCTILSYVMAYELPQKYSVSSGHDITATSRNRKPTEIPFADTLTLLSERWKGESGTSHGVC